MSVETSPDSSRDLLRDFLDWEREEAKSRANLLSLLWYLVTGLFLIFTLLFVFADANPRWLASTAEEYGAPALLAERLELAALAPVLANLSGAVFLNFWRARRRKLQLILAEALVLDREYDMARGVLFGADKKKKSGWRAIVRWARGARTREEKQAADELAENLDLAADKARTNIMQKSGNADHGE